MIIFKRHFDFTSCTEKNWWTVGAKQSVSDSLWQSVSRNQSLMIARCLVVAMVSQVSLFASCLGLVSSVWNEKLCESNKGRYFFTPGSCMVVRLEYPLWFGVLVTTASASIDKADAPPNNPGCSTHLGSQVNTSGSLFSVLFWDSAWRMRKKILSHCIIGVPQYRGMQYCLWLVELPSIPGLWVFLCIPNCTRCQMTCPTVQQEWSVHSVCAIQCSHIWTSATKDCMESNLQCSDCNWVDLRARSAVGAFRPRNTCTCTAQADRVGSYTNDINALFHLITTFADIWIQEGLVLSTMHWGLPFVCKFLQS